MKKLDLNLDALLSIVIVFALSFGFNFFQRYQYSDLLKEHIGMQIQAESMEFNLTMKDAMLKKCTADSVAPVNSAH